MKDVQWVAVTRPWSDPCARLLCRLEGGRGAELGRQASRRSRVVSLKIRAAGPKKVTAIIS